VKLFLQAAHKTISHSVPEIPSLVSLGVIVVALTVAVVTSLRRPEPDRATPGGVETPEVAQARD
jgi:tellurite resistance protein TerC